LNIKKRRLQLGISQQQLANAVGVDRSAVSQWENGKTLPRSNRLKLLAKTLKTTIGKLTADT